MPKKSRYSDKEFEALTQDLIISLEKHNADRDLSIMALGNLITNIFNNQTDSSNREAMVEQFCSVLKKSTKQ